MRIESAVTSISWIPSEAVEGVTKVPFEMGLAHYDDPPPDHIESLEALQAADRFRFANRLAPVVGDGWVRFSQTCGGRTGVPAPRRVNRPPFVQLAAPLAWTSLTLTVFSDGTSSHELTGASPFPRHWVYDRDQNLALKSGLVDFKRWYQPAFGKHTP